MERPWAWIAPVGVAGAAVVAATYVRAVDPARGGLFLRCPIHAMTGLSCPGCGMTRALHQALGGDVAAALGTNALLPLAAALAVALWIGWLTSTLGRRNPIALVRLPTWTWVTLGGLALLYGALRNAPGALGTALGP